ncbi:hypothetical protein GEMRC1_006753 [Eukaryota sp. GEM-RC1]
MHHKPTFSQTILFSHLYMNPKAKRIDKPHIEKQIEIEDQRHFDEFYEDIFLEFTKHGKVETVSVVDNICDHMVGNTFVKFSDEDEAAAALEAVQGRWYNQRPVVAEFSPVSDFREARCRQNEKDNCNRGGYCNFIHMKHPTGQVHDELLAIQDDYWKRKLKRVLDVSFCVIIM